MVKALTSMIVAGTVAAAAGTAAGQTPPVARGGANNAYQIGQMERVLEGAVEHGLTITRDRVQALAQVPADLLVSENAHARGFRLEGYGVFFDVVVPSFETTLTWSLRTLDQNDLGLESALRTLQRTSRREGDPDLEQALKRVELQVGPAVLARSTGAGRPRRAQRHRIGRRGARRPAAAAADPILSDPNEAYRTEVLQALKDAMLAHSSSLGIAPTEWLTIAAKGNDDRPRLAPADSGSSTRIIRLRGSDLAEFLAGELRAKRR